MFSHCRAAVVGCGSNGNAHMQGYNLVDNVDVVAEADPLPAARQTSVDGYGLPAGAAATGL